MQLTRAVYKVPIDTDIIRTSFCFAQTGHKTESTYDGILKQQHSFRPSVFLKFLKQMISVLHKTINIQWHKNWTSQWV